MNTARRFSAVALLLACVALVLPTRVIAESAPADSTESDQARDPCIAAGVKDSVVFLGTMREKEVAKSAQAPATRPAQDGANLESVFVATAFLIRKDDMDYLVTAKHVLSEFKESFGEKAELDVFLNFKKGNVFVQSISMIKKNFAVDWVIDPSSDIAAIPFLASPDFDIKTIPETLFASAPQVQELQGLFFISYQPGIGALGRIRPITRAGMVSVFNDDGSFYMDAFTFPGNSGSPVFIRPQPLWMTSTGVVNVGDPLRCKLAGVVSGYLPYQEVAVSLQTKHPRVVFEENTGLALVSPVSAITRLFSSDAFVAQHNRIREKTK
jgi:hypothetical protein